MNKFYFHKCDESTEYDAHVLYSNMNLCWYVSDRGQHPDAIQNISFCPYCGASLLEIYKGEKNENKTNRR